MKFVIEEDHHAEEEIQGPASVALPAKASSATFALKAAENFRRVAML